MRRLAKILSFICAGCLIAGALQIALQLPADSSRYIEKKYSGWSGVLRGWVYSDWSCSGSFISWLNRCAAEFEKQHEGVYLEFENVSRSTLAANEEFKPDMLIFSDGALPGGEGVPIAMGGYVFAENPDAAGCAIPAEYAAPLIAMFEQTDIDLPDSGIDLGLPAVSGLSSIEISDDAFDRFIGGGLGRTIINQSQLAKLIRLRNEGRGPNWQCRAQGRYSWCDQRLMLTILQQTEERRELCSEFLALLLSDAQQASLADIGAFPVTGISAYNDFSAYRAMEQQLLATEPIFAKPEHCALDFAGLVRKLDLGQISPEEAAAILVQTCS